MLDLVELGDDVASGAACFYPVPDAGCVAVPSSPRALLLSSSPYMPHAMSGCGATKHSVHLALSFAVITVLALK